MRMFTLCNFAVQWSFWTDHQYRREAWLDLQAQSHEEGTHTRSSRSSASALNLFTKPDKPIEPARPRATSGLSFDSSAVSRKTIRGYAIGIPIIADGRLSNRT